MDNITKLDIQPDASIYGVFSRLNYKIWFAIAEFVDNSTASFFKYERALKFYKIHKCRVDITYNDEDDCLLIRDDAYGMELHDFERAIKLDQKPENIDGRNEFGMGLKTAASWFGNMWSVESTQLGSVNKYFAEVNITLLKEQRNNNVDIYKYACNSEEHGTTVTIRQLTKKIEGGRTIGKIKDILRSMYRRDINSGKVEIYFNGELLTFEPYDVLNYNGEEWRKNLNFNFKFNDHQFTVCGFVGILGEKSSGFNKAGFALFRRNRIIIGGEGTYYKPQMIFQQAQSKISHKLFGELDLDDFPINQSKDGFIWDDGLETSFLQELKKNIQEYITIANKTSKELNPKLEEMTEKVVEDVHKEITDTLINLRDDGHNIDQQKSEIEEKFDALQDQIVVTEKVLVLSTHHYNVPLNKFDSVNLAITWTHTGDEYWFKKVIKSSHEWDVKINISHPFFEPFYHHEDFKAVLEKFVIAFLLSTEYASRNSINNGYVLPSDFEIQMNKLLASLAKK